jgi:polyhydroxybutyrate depolymerase
MPRLRLFALCAALSGAFGCSSSTDATPNEPPLPPPTEFGGDRPVTLRLPDAFDPSVERPLLVMIHGYQSSGIVEEAYLKLAATASERGYLYLTPDGTFNAGGVRFWNDWPGDHDNSAVDDVGYLKQLIADVRAAYKVDAKRIYVTGHSNGGAMTHRLACELSDELAAAAVFAGDMPVSPEAVCKPTSPLHLLQFHGDKDAAVVFAGNEKNLGAKECVAFWAAHDGCTGTEEGTPLDLVTDLGGAETTVLRHTGCTGGSAELWTMAGAGHVPGFTPGFRTELFDYFDGHTK